MSSRFPIAYWPSISYVQQLLLQETICFEVYETYQKQSIRNRCMILTANGIQELSIPVKKPDGSKTLTKNIQIDFSQDWQTNHWRAIRTAYSSAPYFEHYASEVEQLIFQEETNLLEFNKPIFDRVCKWFGLNISSNFTSEFQNQYETDFLNQFKERDPFSVPFYQQVFSDRTTFEPDLSVLDLIFNVGPMGRKLLFL